MATGVIQVQGQLEWKCFRANGGNWIGFCDPLKLTVQSETWAELMEDIGLTLDAVLKDLLASNELTRFLKDQGWGSRWSDTDASRRRQTF